MSIIRHETIESHMKTNTVFCCTTIKDPKYPGHFLIGSENKHIMKYDFFPKEMTLEKIGTYYGHSNSVKNV